MYILHYDFVALFLNVINLAVFIYLKNLRDPKSGILFVMLINSLLTTLLDILSSLTIGHTELYSHRYSSLVTTIYYILNNNKVYIYVAYVLVLTGYERRIKLWKKRLISLPFILTTLLILLNPFTNFIFSIDSNLIYYRETGLFILYIFASLYLVYGTISTIRYKKQMNRITFRALISFIVIYLASLSLQTLYPIYLLQSFGTAVCELLLIMIIQNRNEVIDGTTNLYNQTAFYDKLMDNINHAIPFSITLIMLEDTTLINYSLGHRYLNQIIQDVSNFIKKELPAHGKFYLRNNCFALLSMKNQDKRYNEIRDKVMRRFQDTWFVNDLSISLSVRICQIKFPDHIGSYSDLYDYIDYLSTAPAAEIKDEAVGISEISINVHKREQEIRKIVALAMANQTFEVYYQPIYSARDRRFISAEALVRLKDPKLGFIPPDEFIPLSERDGTITKLGIQIFEMVCSFMRKSRLTTKGLRYIEVNLSVVQCMQSNLQEQLSTIMKKYKIKPDQICLEITETVAVNTPEVVRILFKELHKNGMSFALDDYGSGYSNVNYILELPFNFVKLDKSIIWGYFKNVSGKIALESTIAMMKSLNIELIAEGVEIKEQADVLAALGVNYLQGYYYSKPIPSAEFEAFISEKNAILQQFN